MNRSSSSRRFRALFTAAALLAAPVLAPSPVAWGADPAVASQPNQSILEEASLQYWQGFGEIPQFDAPQQKLLAEWKTNLGTRNFALLQQILDQLREITDPYAHEA